MEILLTPKVWSIALITARAAADTTKQKATKALCARNALGPCRNHRSKLRISTTIQDARRIYYFFFVSSASHVSKQQHSYDCFNPRNIYVEMLFEFICCWDNTAVFFNILTSIFFI